MSVKVKEIKSKLGYVIDSISMTQNGDCYVNTNIGTISTNEKGNTFTPIANQNFHITPDEMKTIMVDLAEPVPLRDLVEHALEQHLISKGLLGA